MSDDFDFMMDADWQVRSVELFPSAIGISHSEWYDPHLHYYWEIKFFTDVSRVVIIPPETVHPMTKHDESAYLKVLALNRPELMLSSVGEHRQELQMRFVAVDALCPGGLTGLCNQIQASCANNGNALLANALAQLLVRAVGTAKSNEANLVSPGKSITALACDYISRYYYRPDLTIEAVAEYVGVSPGYLANLFQNERLGTVRQYLVKTRLDNALRMLQRGTYSVKDAAILSGWNSPFYFSNTFYRYFRKRPSDIAVTGDTLNSTV